MTIHETREGNSLTVAVEGRLDTLAAPDLEKTLDNCPPSIGELVLDFEKMEYISSAGLRTVLHAQKIMQNRGGSLRIRNTNKLVYDVFRVTGLANILQFE